MMKAIIDRFDEDFAVCELENQEMVNIEIAKLPEGVKRGMVLNIDGDKITMDINETEKLEKEVDRLLKDLWE